MKIKPNPFSIFQQETLKEHATMIPVEGGTFTMGAFEEDKNAMDRERPLHEVKVDSFYIGKHPVTQAIWQTIMGENPSSFKGANRPVENISWNQIVHDFLPKLNEQTKSNRPAGTMYRLPTEAEWEYVAKGGEQKNDYLYAGGNKLEEVAWYFQNSNNESKPVGLKLPNTLGIHDMSGNVREWCHDWHSGNYYQQCADKGLVENPRGPKTGTTRVLRGGSWINDPQDCRATDRDYNSPGLRTDDLGCRLVLSSLPV